MTPARKAQPAQMVRPELRDLGVSRGQQAQTVLLVRKAPRASRDQKAHKAQRVRATRFRMLLHLQEAACSRWRRLLT